MTGDDRLCDQSWMDHPLKYLRAKQRSRLRDSESAQDEGETSEEKDETRDGS